MFNISQRQFGMGNSPRPTNTMQLPATINPGGGGLNGTKMPLPSKLPMNPGSKIGGMPLPARRSANNMMSMAKNMGNMGR